MRTYEHKNRTLLSQMISAVMKTQNQRMSDVRKPKKQASITSFIYKDGPTRGSSTSTPDRSKRKDKEVQVTPSIEEQLCGDEANEDYWRELAIEREKALNDTLEENRSLCELIQGLVCIQFTRFSVTLEISVRTAEKEEIEEVLDQITKENGLLKEKAERADVLAEVIQERVQHFVILL